MLYAYFILWREFCGPHAYFFFWTKIYTKLGFVFESKFGPPRAQILKVLKLKVKVKGGPKSVKSCLRTQKDWCKTSYACSMLTSYFGENYVALMLTFFSGPKSTLN